MSPNKAYDQNKLMRMLVTPRELKIRKDYPALPLNQSNKSSSTSWFLHFLCRESQYQSGIEVEHRVFSRFRDHEVELLTRTGCLGENGGGEIIVSGVSMVCAVQPTMTMREMLSQ